VVVEDTFWYFPRPTFLCPEERQLKTQQKVPNDFLTVPGDSLRALKFQ
jgi:hypothetical protein